ncbi:MAG TPA: class I SAM-dependent methyltransferase [Thermoanaerobaculia bacterium]|nr:class I SAM-dependent methyltransferase [Thermoanaerobaculia bacterium]
MNLRDLQKNWNQLGKTDPFWAVLTDPSKRYGRWNRDEFFGSGREEVEKTLARIKVLGVELPRDHALDFGCGVGRLSQALATHFERVTALDIAPSMIRVAKKYNKFPDRCHYLVNDSDRLPLLADNSVDLVNASIVLQHMEPGLGRGYIAEFLRILRPGGIAAFQVPSHFIETESEGGSRGAEVSETLTRPHGHPLPPGEGGRDHERSQLGVEGFKASLHVIDMPRRVETGSSSTLTVRVKNLGREIWPGYSDGPFAIRLGNHWMRQSPKLWFSSVNGRRRFRDELMIVEDDGRSPLPHDLRPGEETEITLCINAPRTEGRFVVELDMVQENVCWFGERGSKVLRVPVKVEGAIMEMYGIPKEEIADLVASSGGELISVERDVSPGDRWISYSYLARKTS